MQRVKEKRTKLIMIKQRETEKKAKAYHGENKEKIKEEQSLS